MAQYCKSQMQINKVDKSSEDEYKAISERIRTYRSLLTDELNARNLTCVELHPDGAEAPVYIRMRSSSHAPPVDVDFIVRTLRELSAGSLDAAAEKHGGSAEPACAADMRWLREGRAAARAAFCARIRDS